MEIKANEKVNQHNEFVIAKEQANQKTIKQEKRTMNTLIFEKRDMKPLNVLKKIYNLLFISKIYLF